MNTQYWSPHSYCSQESSEVYASYHHQPRRADAWMKNVRASNDLIPTFVEKHTLEPDCSASQQGTIKQIHGRESNSDFILQQCFEEQQLTSGETRIESRVHQSYRNKDSFLPPIAHWNGDVAQYTPEHCDTYPSHGLKTSQPDPWQTQTQSQPQVPFEQTDFADLSDSLGTLSWSGQSSSTLSPCFSVPDDNQDTFTQFPVNEAHWGNYEIEQPEQISRGSLETSHTAQTESGDTVTSLWLSRNEEASEQFSVNFGSEAISDLFFLTCSPSTQATNPGFDVLPLLRSSAESVEDIMGDTLLSRTEEPYQGIMSNVSIPSTDASLTDTTPPDVEMIPQKQVVKNADDLYVPRWIRGHGKNREAWCGTCDRWFCLKRSAYWYHQNFSHGIHRGGYRYPQPIEVRNTMMETAWDGLCGTCERWIPLGASNKTDTSWYRHVYKCAHMAAPRVPDRKIQPKGPSLRIPTNFTASQTMYEASMYLSQPRNRPGSLYS